MPYPGYTTEEVGHRGQMLYEQQIRDKVEAEHAGKFLVVDSRPVRTRLTRTTTRRLHACGRGFQKRTFG